MRPSVWLTVIAVGLLAAGLRNSASAQQAAREHTKNQGRVHPLRNQAVPPKTLAGWTVESTWARTREQSVMDALEKAQEKVAEWLRAQSPPLEWKPTPEFIRDRLLRDLPPDEGFVAAGDDVIPEKITVHGHIALEEARDFKAVRDAFEGEGLMQRVCLRVAITEADLSAIRQQESLYQAGQRQARAAQRQGLAAKGLAAVVAVLLAVAAYLRLEDATKGYYTALLRLVAVGFVALVGAGIFFLS